MVGVNLRLPGNQPKVCPAHLFDSLKRFYHQTATLAPIPGFTAISSAMDHIQVFPHQNFAIINWYG